MGKPKVIKIFLTQKQVALIDDEDFEKISKYNWCAAWCSRKKSYYAVTNIRINGKRKTLGMHRFIMGLNLGDMRQVDHINHNTLDNTRSNLRICTHKQNQHNTKKYKNNKSGYKGVSWHRASRKWMAYIRVNCKRIYLGLFDTKMEAAIAYDEAAQKYHKEFAELNFSLRGLE